MNHQLPQNEMGLWWYMIIMHHIVPQSNAPTTCLVGCSKEALKVLGYSAEEIEEAESASERIPSLWDLLLWP